MRIQIGDVVVEDNTPTIARNQQEQVKVAVLTPDGATGVRLSTLLSTAKIYTRVGILCILQRQLWSPSDTQFFYAVLLRASFF